MLGLSVPGHQAQAIQLVSFLFCKLDLGRAPVRGSSPKFFDQATANLNLDEDSPETC